MAKLTHCMRYPTHHARAAILAYDDCYASSLSGFADILQIANAHVRRQRGDGTAQFEWRFVSPTGAPVMASNGLQLNTEPIRPHEQFDVVFIPSAHYASGKAFDQLLSRQSAMRLAGFAMARRRLPGGKLHRHVRAGQHRPSRRTARDDHVVAGRRVSQPVSPGRPSTGTRRHRSGPADLCGRVSVLPAADHPCHRAFLRGGDCRAVRQDDADRRQPDEAIAVSPVADGEDAWRFAGSPRAALAAEAHDEGREDVGDGAGPRRERAHDHPPLPGHAASVSIAVFAEPAHRSRARFAGGRRSQPRADHGPGGV